MIPDSHDYYGVGRTPPISILATAENIDYIIANEAVKKPDRCIHNPDGSLWGFQVELTLYPIHTVSAIRLKADRP